MPTLLERALIATRAPRRIELKPTFAPDETDVAARANSGGGVIVCGVNRHGEPTSAGLPSVAEAQRRRRDFEIGEAVKFGKRLLTAIVAEAATPIVCDGIVYI